jgi:hypothetical protein
VQKNAKKVQKNAKNAKKMRKSAKCECDAKVESKFASHRTTAAKKIRIFALFRIALPSLARSTLTHQFLVELNSTVPTFPKLPPKGRFQGNWGIPCIIPCIILWDEREGREGLNSRNGCMIRVTSR